MRALGSVRNRVRERVREQDNIRDGLPRKRTPRCESVEKMIERLLKDGSYDMVSTNVEIGSASIDIRETASKHWGIPFVGRTLRSALRAALKAVEGTR